MLDLKRLPRTGWLDRGVPPADTESVAEHSFQTTLLAWIVAQEDASLDADRVLKLALVHDLAEALTGDPPPYDRAEVPADPAARRAFFSVRRIRTAEQADAKHRAEQEASARLLALLPNASRAEIAALWEEYETRATPEARFVKQVDRLEAFLQARRYAADHPDVPVDGFTDMARHELTHPALVALRDDALAD